MKSLAGLLAVSVEQAVAAPLCTARLVEGGARVIKIERPGGDFARGYDTAAKGDSSYFLWTNQGKESVVLDFKTEAGAAFLRRLISRADIFVQNLAPHALERAGFGAADLRRDNPRLITCDISGYGDNEAVSALKAYDLLVQAESGLVGISGGPNEMGRIGVSICDIGAGMTAHAAIVEALLLRASSGKGSGVKVSLFDVAAEWMTVPFIHEEYGRGAPARQGLRHPSIAPYGAYRSAEGLETIVSIQNEREWQRFCGTVLARPDLAVDERFDCNNRRVANRDLLDREIDSVVGRLPVAEYRRRLAAASLAYGAVNSVADLAQHAALRTRTAVSSGGAAVDIPAAPIRWADSEPAACAGVPQVGAHTESVRAEFGEPS